MIFSDLAKECEVAAESLRWDCKDEKQELADLLEKAAIAITSLDMLHRLSWWMNDL